MDNRQFRPELESLRGVAALAVAFFHSMGAIVLLSPLDASILAILKTIGSGSVAVTIFFILSGYVLGLSLKSNEKSMIGIYPEFVKKRFFRLYPAMAVCLAVCSLYLLFIHTPQHYEAANKAYYDYWQNKISFKMFLEDMLFLGNQINVVTWTLQIEMLGSLLFVFLYYTKQKFPKLAIALLVAWIVFFVYTPLYSYLRSGFVYMFLLALYVENAINLINIRIPSHSSKIMLFGALGCFTTQALIPDTRHLYWILESIFATLLIAGLESYRQNSGGGLYFLRLQAVSYVGKISYSFYLYHFPILYISATAMFCFIPSYMLLSQPIIFQFLLFIFSVIITLPIAGLSYKFVEKRFKR